MKIEGLRSPHRKAANLNSLGRMLPPDLRQRRANRAVPLLAAAILSATLCCPRLASAANAYVPFDGEKTTWHDNFDRYDYLMDEASSAITPFKRPDSEKFAVGTPPKGQRRCI